MSKFPTNIVASLRGWWEDDMVYEHEGPTERYIRADLVAEKDAEIERFVAISGKREALFDQQQARITFLEKALDEMFLMFEEARKDSQRLAVVYSYNGDMASEDHQDAKCKRLADFAAAYLRERDAKS